MESELVRNDSLNKVLANVELLVEDEIAKKRLVEIKKDPTILKSENELNDYLKKRGVKTERMANKVSSKYNQRFKWSN